MPKAKEVAEQPAQQALREAEERVTAWPYRTEAVTRRHK